MTHAIGAGTCNVTVNLTLAERAILGREATKRDLSIGEFIRRRLRRGIAMTDPETAQRLARARRDRLSSAVMVLLLGVYSFIGADQMRRPVRRRWSVEPAIQQEVEAL